MLWNWNTIDACFLSSQWHITSNAMFAGSCLAVMALVLALEALRRAVKEYDRHLVRRHLGDAATASAVLPPLPTPPPPPPTTRAAAAGHCAGKTTPGGSVSTTGGAAAAAEHEGSPLAGGAPPPPTRRFRPTLPQQAVRALLHMLQFAVAYFIML